MRKVLFTLFVAYAGLASGTGLNPSPPPSAPISAVAEVAPDVMLRNATAALAVTLAPDIDCKTNTPAQVAALAEPTLLPLFDFGRMTELAVARNWRAASPSQQSALVAEFRKLLVRTYAMTLTSCRSHNIEYKPLHLAATTTAVTVKSVVTQPGSGRRTIDYDMERTATGWKANDIWLDGVSMVASYQSFFAQTVRAVGLDGLIKVIAAKNRLADAGLGAHESNARIIIFLHTIVPSVMRSSQ